MSTLCIPFTVSRIICLSAAVIFGIIAISVIIYGIMKSVSLRRLKFLQPFLITYYITCTLWIISIIGYILFQALPYFEEVCSKPDSFMIINSIFGVSMGFCGYLFGLIGIYYLFLLRLKHSFVDTLLEISNTKYYVLLSGVFIQIVLVILTAYCFIMFQWDIGLILSYSSIIINAIYSISLLTLFSLNILNLDKQIIHQQQFAHKPVLAVVESTKTDNNIAATFNNTSTELVTVTSTKQSANTIQTMHPYNDLAEITVKFVICASFAFLSSIIVNFMSFYRGLIVEDTWDLLCLHVSLNVLDCLITVICLHLQFSYSTMYYIKLCKCLRVSLKSYVLSKLDQQYQYHQSETIETEQATSKTSITAQSVIITQFDNCS